MSVYIFNYLLCGVWFFSRNHKISIIVIGIQLFLLLALRSDTLGVDLEEYQILYNCFSENTLWEIIKGFRLFANTDVLFGRESGYVLLNWICGNLGLSFHTFLILQSAICVTSLCFFIKRYSKIPWLSFALIIALGLYTYMFCILRQAFAVAILYFAFPYIKNRNFIKFLLCICAASLFHVVSIAFLPLYWIANITVTVKNISILIGVSLSLPLVLRGSIASFLASLGKTYEFSNEVVYNNLLILIMFLLGFVFYFYSDLLNQKNTDDSIIYLSCLWAFPIQMLSLIMPILGRASVGIFFPLLAILIPNLIYKNKDSNSQPFFSLLFYLMFFAYFMMIFSQDSSRLIPYRSYYF